MDVIRKAKDGDSYVLTFWCPGCREYHGVWPKENPNPLTGASWTWNGSLSAPTFSPSILVQGKPRCHSFVEGGVIRFLSDCQHSLAGQSLRLAPDPLESAP